MIVLIGGSSLAGKSTLAERLGQLLGWEVVHTDFLARHPGRPWATPERTPPPHVPQYFLNHPPEELLEDVLRHYRSLAPTIRELANEEVPRVIEGSAVLPELAHELRIPRVFVIAREGLLTERIRKHAESEGIAHPGAFHEPSRKFAERAELMNVLIRKETERLGLDTIDAESKVEETAQRLAAMCE